MSGGPRREIEPAIVARAFARAQHTIAAVFIVAVLLVLVLARQGALVLPHEVVWPLAVFLVGALAVLFARRRIDSDALTLLYVALVGAALFLLAREYLAGIGPLRDEGFSLLALKVALVFVGSAHVRAVQGMLWVVIGGVVSEGMVLAAAVATDAPVTFDRTLAVLALVLLVCRPLVAAMMPRYRRAWERITAAATDEERAVLSDSVEARAAALVHDTVLHQLSMIVSAKLGELEPQLRGRIEHDLQLVADRAWLSESHPEADADEWHGSDVLQAVQDARTLGLQVATSGDMSAVARLDRERASALGLAVAQCLTNVHRHAGTDAAEVAIYSAGDDVCVMVVDEGRGFDDESLPRDRLGLRTSVHRRIRAVGGEVRVWSTPGHGTSIMIRVPSTRVAT